MRYHHAILPRMAQVAMKIADTRYQLRPGFAPRRCEAQQRCGPSIKIGAVNVCPGLSLPRAKIEFPQPVIDRQRPRKRSGNRVRQTPAPDRRTAPHPPGATKSGFRQKLVECLFIARRINRNIQTPVTGSGRDPRRRMPDQGDPHFKLIGKPAIMNTTLWTRAATRWFSRPASSRKTGPAASEGRSPGQLRC